MDWTIERTTSFIEDYHNYPGLWNNKISSYKDVRVKIDLLKQLADKYNCTVPEVKKKIKNLRSAFHRERKKLQSKKGGSSSNKKGKWFAFELLSFLADGDAPESTFSTAESDEEYIEEKGQGGSQDTQDANAEVNRYQKLVEVSNKRIKNSCEVDREICIIPKKQTRKDLSPSHREKEANSNLINDCQTDACSTYGEYVANELRNLGSRTQTLVKHMINNTLFDAAMGKYD